MYALTFVISSGVRIRFGIFGCELVRKTRMAVAVHPSGIGDVAERRAKTWDTRLCKKCATSRPTIAPQPMAGAFKRNLLRPDNRLEYRMGQFLDIAPGGGRLRIGAVC